MIISCLKINTEEKEEEEEAKKKHIQNRKEIPKHVDANKQTNNASTLFIVRKQNQNQKRSRSLEQFT
jgi:hypothetical protein